jgi:hypothetical protein
MNTKYYDSNNLASQRRIPLSKLFVYPEAGAANPLAFYWKGELWNIQ